MEVAEDRIEDIDDLAVRLIGHAMMAQAYGAAIQRDPALAGGFEKLAGRHRAAVKTLCGDLGAAATGLIGMGAVVLPLAAVRR